MVRAPDLSRASFQQDASDDEIAAVIRNGRGKMPAFQKLPPRVVDGLVQLIRKMGTED
jgi:cytochrome c oxidase cbb3-type subunit 3